MQVFGEVKHRLYGKNFLSFLIRKHSSFVCEELITLQQNKRSSLTSFLLLEVNKFDSTIHIPSPVCRLYQYYLFNLLYIMHLLGVRIACICIVLCSTL